MEILFKFPTTWHEQEAFRYLQENAPPPEVVYYKAGRGFLDPPGLILIVNTANATFETKNKINNFFASINCDFVI